MSTVITTARGLYLPCFSLSGSGELCSRLCPINALSLSGMGGRERPLLPLLHHKEDGASREDVSLQPATSTRRDKGTAEGSGLDPAGDVLPGVLAGDVGGFLGKLTNSF